MSFYDPFYKRMKLAHYLDNGVKKELMLPFCELFDSTSLSHSSDVKHAGTNTSFMKRINRRSPLTIKGIIGNDSELKDYMPNMGLNYINKDVDYYINAITNLEPTIMFICDGIFGLLFIESKSIESYGKTRKFEITGYRIC